MDDAIDLPGGFGRIRTTRYGRMLFNPNDVYMGRSFDLYGEYSGQEAKFLSFLLRPGDVVVEAGANIGALTVPLAQKVGPEGWVVAFEPQRIVFQMLCANVMLNGLINVETRNAAVGRVSGRVEVPDLDPRRANNFGGLPLEYKPEPPDDDEVFVRMLDVMAGEDEPDLRGVPVEIIDALGLTRCRLIKADVEGMEGDVLAGAADTIARCRPFLYVENDRRDRSPVLLRQVWGMNYRAWWHLPPYFSPDNFYGHAENVFPREVSFNLFCAPREAGVSVNMPEITDEASWPV